VPLEPRDDRGYSRREMKQHENVPNRRRILSGSKPSPQCLASSRQLGILFAMMILASPAYAAVQAPYVSAISSSIAIDNAAGQRLSVAPPPCTYTFPFNAATTSIAWPSAGGGASILLQTQVGCPWTSSSNAAW